MQKPYVAPELKLVGETNEVVLGSMQVGHDLSGEMLPHGKEFEPDGSPMATSR
jgi:hypothetical protein